MYLPSEYVRTDCDGSAVARVSDGVVHECREHVVHAEPVGVDHGQVVPEENVDPVLPRVRLGLEVPNDLLGHGRQIHRSQLEGQGLLLQSRHLQHLAYERIDPVDRVQHRRELLLQLWRDLSVKPLRGHLEVAHHGRERRPQLVRYCVHQAVLRLIHQLDVLVRHPDGLEVIPELIPQPGVLYRGGGVRCERHRYLVLLARELPPLVPVQVEHAHDVPRLALQRYAHHRLAAPLLDVHAGDVFDTRVLP